MGRFLVTTAFATVELAASARVKVVPAISVISAPLRSAAPKVTPAIEITSPTTKFSACNALEIVTVLLPVVVFASGVSTLVTAAEATVALGAAPTTTVVPEIDKIPAYGAAEAPKVTPAMEIRSPTDSRAAWANDPIVTDVLPETVVAVTSVRAGGGVTTEITLLPEYP
jgi:hypothetical protein